MIDILFDRVQYHKDKFIAPILHDEMATMVMKPNGKIEHNPDAHDDQVFSYLHALRPLYDNAAFLSREFGIRKFSIKTDEDEEIVEGDLDAQNGGFEFIDIDTSDYEDADSEIARVQEYIKDAEKYKTSREFTNEQQNHDSDLLALTLGQNPIARDAYNKKYNLSTEDTGRTMVRLPDSIFMQDDNGDYEDETSGLYGQVDNGNLSDLFTKL